MAVVVSDIWDRVLLATISSGLGLSGDFRSPGTLNTPSSLSYCTSAVFLLGESSASETIKASPGVRGWDSMSEQVAVE